jgi:hypothetical protein
VQALVLVLFLSWPLVLVQVQVSGGVQSMPRLHQILHRIPNKRCVAESMVSGVPSSPRSASNAFSDLAESMDNCVERKDTLRDACVWIAYAVRQPRQHQP